MFVGAIRGNRFRTKAYMPSSEEPDWVDWNVIRRKKLQYLVTGYSLQVIEVTGEPADIIDLFVKINSTGKALTGAEKRHASYYQSGFLKKAGQLARRFEPFLKGNKVVSANQIARMKHVELMCELVVAAHHEGVTNKKTALDQIMKSDSIDGRGLEKAIKSTITALGRLKNIFPDFQHTRFRQLSDFYTLAVVVQRFEREGMILLDKRRNKLASQILTAFSAGVDQARLRQKKAEGAETGQELYRQYLLTVLEGTDEIGQRRRREQILQGVLEPLFEKKDKDRFFSPEQRRILWNTEAARKCATCKKPLTWDDFTIDHIDPWSKGGKTSLENAAIMCRVHNSAKGNRRRFVRP